VFDVRNDKLLIIYSKIPFSRTVYSRKMEKVGSWAKGMLQGGNSANFVGCNGHRWWGNQMFSGLLSDQRHHNQKAR
jgi:hypothetical protein